MTAPNNESDKETLGADSIHANHWKALTEESGIEPGVIEARGYRSVTRAADLRRLGFGSNQLLVPTLVLPLWGVSGEGAGYQSRPDGPRILKGKLNKYETPKGMRMALDVHPSMRPSLRDPSVSLWITEGIKKGDSLTSRGCCAISLLGVWNWRGTNDLGGKTALADWESITLNPRPVFIVFDSDVMQKQSVHAALKRLGAFLERRGADVNYVYLPVGTDQDKVGVDDYLVAGHTIEELQGLASKILKKPLQEEDDGPYRNTPSGLFWVRETQDGPIEVPLTNFGAVISTEVMEDDGVDTHRSFEVEATLEDRTFRFVIPSEHFAIMNWVTEKLGARAIVHPGLGTKDRARAAIQFTSKNVEERVQYTHTGWRLVNGQWLYLHAGGAIGPDGPEEAINVSLPTGLEKFALQYPTDTEVERDAVRASLRVLKLAPLHVTLPLLLTPFRAVLGKADFGVHLVGATGAGKSELAALAEQHFGAEMDARNLPGSWSSTANAMEALAFYTKDAVLVVDDFAPQGSANDIRRKHSEADRLLRAQGNHSGRQRMRADASLRSSKPPRGLILSTGEDVPLGQSLRARLLIVELANTDLDWQLLTACQRDAAEGLYAMALAGFLHRLAPKYEVVLGSRTQELNDLAAQVSSSSRHRRTPRIIAGLAWAYRHFLAYAVAVDAITAEEEAVLWQDGWLALLKAGALQAELQGTQSPAERFISLIRSGLVGGQCHLQELRGGHPLQDRLWGWREIPGDEIYPSRWQPQGRCIGWVKADDVYLEPDGAFAVAKRLGEEQGDTLGVSRVTLEKRLGEAGVIASFEAGRFTTRKVIDGKQRRVLHLLSAQFDAHEPESGLHGLLGPYQSEPDSQN